MGASAIMPDSCELSEILPPRAPTSLLDLPPEILCDIFSFAVAPTTEQEGLPLPPSLRLPGHSAAGSLGHATRPGSQEHATALALPLICKACYGPGMRVLCATVVFTRPQQIFRWIRTTVDNVDLASRPYDNPVQHTKRLFLMDRARGEMKWNPKDGFVLCPHFASVDHPEPDPHSAHLAKLVTALEATSSSFNVKRDFASCLIGLLLYSGPHSFHLSVLLALHMFFVVAQLGPDSTLPDHPKLDSHSADLSKYVTALAATSANFNVKPDCGSILIGFIVDSSEYSFYVSVILALQTFFVVVQLSPRKLWSLGPNMTHRSYWFLLHHTCAKVTTLQRIVVVVAVLITFRKLAQRFEGTQRLERKLGTVMWLTGLASARFSYKPMMVLQRCLEFVPSRALQYLVSRVRQNALIRTIVQHTNVPTYPSLRLHGQRFLSQPECWPKMPILQEMGLTCPMPDMLSSVLDFAPNLRYLCIQDLEFSSNEARQRKSRLSLKRLLESLPNLSELVLLESLGEPFFERSQPVHRLQDLPLSACSSLVSVTLQGWPYEDLFAVKELAFPPRMKAFSFYPALHSFPFFSALQAGPFREDFMEMLSFGPFAPCRPLIFGVPYLWLSGHPEPDAIPRWADFRDEALRMNPNVTITYNPIQGRPLSMEQERDLDDQKEFYGGDLSL